MNSDKLFIEYIIIGSLSIIWILPILLLLDINDSKLNFNIEEILLAIPIAYIVGMTIDYIGALIFKRDRVAVRKKIFESFGYGQFHYYEVRVIIVNFNSNLIRELGIRTSRGRVSRGALMNLLFSLILVPMYFVNSNQYYKGLAFTLFIICLIILTWFMWNRMIKLLYKYQCYTLQHIFKTTNQ